MILECPTPPNAGRSSAVGILSSFSLFLIVGSVAETIVLRGKLRVDAPLRKTPPSL
jgi:hypothetical protein